MYANPTFPRPQTSLVPGQNFEAATTSSTAPSTGASTKQGYSRVVAKRVTNNEKATLLYKSEGRWKGMGTVEMRETEGKKVYLSLEKQIYVEVKDCKNESVTSISVYAAVGDILWRMARDAELLNMRDMQSATKEKLIEYMISLQTSLESRMSKPKRKRRSLRCVRPSEVQPSTPSEWYRARERRSAAQYQSITRQPEDYLQQLQASCQKLGSAEEALSRVKHEHSEQESKITELQRHLMAAEQTVTSQTSELATLRRRLHERDQAAEQKLRSYRHRLSATNQTLVQAQRAAESTTEELLCTKATKEQVEKEFKEACQQMSKLPLTAQQKKSWRRLDEPLPSKKAKSHRSRNNSVKAKHMLGSSFLHLGQN
ncbi:uncharacterized protein PV06_11526 [Exophiala oligosperma]|uniref:Uncharacterized protein n=1 Tax=Exophiala oligosperma TaxID=215243 RepID=A0A0D2CYS3_9EURO|nr:uncharacterized protein PV06_11526 [Exophiala oligosperma]KIW36198.1 hypothetical protein PV06_11526 [Exophiala oligosperma]